MDVLRGEVSELVQRMDELEIKVKMNHNSVQHRLDNIEQRIGNLETRPHPQTDFKSEFCIPTRSIFEWRMPSFNGLEFEDPVEFLNDCENILTESGVPESCFVPAVSHHLKGKASSWFQSKCYMKPSWNDFKKMFFREFDNHNLLTKLKLSLVTDRQDNSSLTDFIQRKLLLQKRLKMDLASGELVTLINDLLDEDFKTLVRVRNPTNEEELVEFAALLENDLTLKKNNKTCVNSKSNSVICFKCRREGHYANECTGCDILDQGNEKKGKSSQ